MAAALNRFQAADAVKALAEKHGFDACGIAAAVPLGGEFERFTQWLEAGYHGTMAWMERQTEKRQDPRLIVPGAQSVIVLAKTYDTPARHPEGTEGKISRYAWGDDYHDVVAGPLAQFCDDVRNLGDDVVCKQYIDTGPVLEKQWAVRSGLAWQGKHSNVIRRDIGSFFFLAVVITTMDCAEDEPIADYCGTCTACIDACPTKAIVQPYVVDSRQCIPYWTIEAKPDVAIPETIAASMDGWLYGCDICQDVCPWNRFRRETTEVAFQPRHGETYLNPTDVITLLPEQFSERFRKSPVKRTKLAGLQRNAQALIDHSSHDEQP
jgi:epoxyqueuosine reductase